MMSLNLPLWQLFLIRSAITIALLMLILRKNLLSKFKLALNAWVLTRSFLIITMYIFFYAGIPILDLSFVAAIYYTGPFFIIMLSVLILREQLQIAHLLAMLVAFAGVIVVLRPTTDGLMYAAVLPFVSAFCYACAAIITRRHAIKIDPWAITLSLNIVFVLIGAVGVGVLLIFDIPIEYPFLFDAWSPLAFASLVILSTLAMISIGIHIFLARAYQLGPLAVVASLDFSYLGFAALWSMLLLGTVPELYTVLGTLLICAAGIFSMLRTRARQS